MKNKNSLKIIIPVLLVSSSAFILFHIKNDLSLNTSQTSNSSTTSSSIKSSDETTTPTNFQQLSVLSNRCRGCGRCAQIDSAHFEMSGRIAIVISSTDLTSQNLALAINNCPAQAITLE